MYWSTGPALSLGKSSPTTNLFIREGEVFSKSAFAAFLPWPLLLRFFPVSVQDTFSTCYRDSILKWELCRETCSSLVFLPTLRRSQERPSCSLLTLIILHGPRPLVTTEAHKYCAGPFSTAAVFSSSSALSFTVVRAGLLSGGAILKPGRVHLELEEGGFFSKWKEISLGHRIFATVKLYQG